MTSAERIPLLNEGDIDIIVATLTKTPERGREVDFSCSYFFTGQRFLARKGTLKTLKDLEGKRVGTAKGTTSLEFATKQLPKTEVVAYETYQDALKDLEQGKLFAVTTGDAMLAGLLRVIGQFHDAVLNKPIADFLKDKKVIERGEISYLTPSGKRIWLGLTLSPLKNSEGLTIGQILIFTDLTHLKAIESQIELRNKLSSLGEISAGIAHELRNPMGVIAGYTKLLSKKADDSLRPTVDAISREIVVMDKIISDFLSFARPVELNPADVDLKAIVEYCFKATAEKRNDIDLQVQLAGLPMIKGDAVLIRQAFINLIQNALEAMPQGGSLKIKASPSGLDFLDVPS